MSGETSVGKHPLKSGRHNEKGDKRCRKKVNIYLKIPLRETWWLTKDIFLTRYVNACLISEKVG